MSGKRRRFTKEFKAEVVKLIVNGGRSVPEVCREHDLGETSVYHWLKQARIDNGQGPAGAAPYCLRGGFLETSAGTDGPGASGER